MANPEQPRLNDISGIGEIYHWPEEVPPFRNFFILSQEELAEFRDAVAASGGRLLWFVHTEYRNPHDEQFEIRPYVARYRHRINDALSAGLSGNIPVIAAIEVPPEEPDRLRILRHYAAAYRQLGDHGDRSVIVIPTYGGSHAPAPFTGEPGLNLSQIDSVVWDHVGTVLRSCGVTTVTLAGRNLCIHNQGFRKLAEPIQQWWNEQHKIRTGFLNYPVVADCVGYTMAELEHQGFRVELSPATYLYPGKEAGRKEFFPWLLE